MNDGFRLTNEYDQLLALGHAGVARFRSLLLGLSVKLPVAQSLGADRRAKALTVI
jgi:hypothetical protein